MKQKIGEVKNNWTFTLRNIKQTKENWNKTTQQWTSLVGKEEKRTTADEMTR